MESVASLQHGKHSPKRARIEEPVKTRRGPWTAEEDELLSNLVKRFGTKRWAIIAELVPGRVGKQCRERWLNHLRTDVKKTAWTDEEDEILIKAQQELGNRWSSIAKLLPGRPENSVKNRWNSLVNKKKRSSSAADDSDNASSDEQSSSASDYTDEFAPTPPASIPRHSSFRTQGSSHGDITEARSLAAMPATTPNSCSPSLGSSFPAKTDMVLPPQPLPQWSLYPLMQQPAMSHFMAARLQQHQPPMHMLDHQKLLIQHHQQQQQQQQQLAQRLAFSTPHLVRKPMQEPQQSPQQQQAQQQVVGDKPGDKGGAAQGLLLLATLCS